MNISTLGIDSYLKAVAGKMNSPTATRLLQFGTKKGFAGQALLRDNEGLYSTKTGILEAAQNHYVVTAGRDEFAVRMANFSVGQNQPSTGYEAVANVKTVGAIDLTIIARSQSIIPFVAVDRTMKNQVDTLFYMDLVALDSAGGVNAGDVVDGNFLPPNPNVKVDFTRSGSFSKGECPTGCNIVPGSVRVSLKRTQTTPAGSQFVEVVGRDFDGQGVIYFPTTYVAKIDADGNPTMGDVNVGEATVDYDDGMIKIASGTDESTKVFYAVDNQANQEGKQTTRVAPQWRNVQLFATEDEIIVQDNLVNRLNMTKVQLLATEGAGGTSPADITFARTKNAYLEAINRKVLRKIVAAAKTPVIDYDLSKYALSDWNTTKNDQITQLIANMEAKYLGQTNVPLTAIITGSYGVALLSCIPNLWTPNPDAVVGLNGLAGYFNGKPVYRHNYLNAHAQTAKNKDGQTPLRFYGIAKLPDNNAGSIVFGEYLPLTSTGVVSNFQQPVNVSTGFFSMTGAAVVDQNLIMMVQIIPPTATFGTEGVGEALVK